MLLASEIPILLFKKLLFILEGQPNLPAIPASI